MCFFLFRAAISYRRRRLITGLRLQEKLLQEDSLCPADYAALRYIVSSLEVSKERWNYAVIFLASFGAIAWDLWIHWIGGP